jgi:tetratricopeptide (TPR) repeat protein
VGHSEESRAFFEESIAILRDLGEQGRQFLEITLARFAFTLCFRNIAPARAYAIEAARLSRESGNLRNLAQSLNVLGLASRWMGEFDTTRGFFEESATISREIGDNSGYSIVLGNLGAAYLGQGDLEKSEESLAKSLAIGREIGNKQVLGNAMRLLGTVAWIRGQYDEAEALLKQAIIESRELGDILSIAGALEKLGRLQLNKGNYSLAEQHLSESISLSSEANDRIFISSVLESFAFLSTALKKPNRAIRLFGAADALREENGTPLLPAERKEYELYLSAARAELDQPAFNVAFEDGKAMTMEQAIEYALHSVPLSDVPVRAPSSTFPQD